MKGKAETTGAGVETQVRDEVRAEGRHEGRAQGRRRRDSKANADQGQAVDHRPGAEQKAGAGCEVERRREGRSGSKIATTSGNRHQAGADSQVQRGGRATAKSGGGASVNLTTEQKTKIRTTVMQSSSAPKVSRSSINFNISVGTVVPRSVHFVSVPSTLVEIHPAWRGYSYFVVDDEIIIVEPRTLQDRRGARSLTTHCSSCDKRRAARSAALRLYMAAWHARTEISAGLLAYRRRDEIEFLLAHPGGPFWAQQGRRRLDHPQGPGAAGRSADRRAPRIPAKKPD